MVLWSILQAEKEDNHSIDYDVELKKLFNIGMRQNQKISILSVKRTGFDIEKARAFMIQSF